MSFTLIIPGKPIPQGRPRTVNKGGNTWTYTPKESSVYRDLAKLLMTVHAKRQKWLFEKTDRYKVDMVIYFADARVHDLDNTAKNIMDAAKGILWYDDNHIRALNLLSKLDRANPRVELFVDKMEDTWKEKK